MIADQAYSSRGFRTYLRKRGLAHTTPEKTDQPKQRSASRHSCSGQDPLEDGPYVSPVSALLNRTPSE